VHEEIDLEKSRLENRRGIVKKHTQTEKINIKAPSKAKTPRQLGSIQQSSRNTIPRDEWHHKNWNVCVIQSKWDAEASYPAQRTALP
jgi:hypothetical protein